MAKKPNLKVEISADGMETIHTDTDRLDKMAAGFGHNSGEASGTRLKSFIERIERLEEEKKTLAEDIRDVYSEAKGTGFEPKIMRKIIKLRKKSLESRREEEELTRLYAAAIQMEMDF